MNFIESNFHLKYIFEWKELKLIIIIWLSGQLTRLLMHNLHHRIKGEY